MPVQMQNVQGHHCHTGTNHETQRWHTERSENCKSTREDIPSFQIWTALSAYSSHRITSLKWKDAESRSSNHRTAIPTKANLWVLSIQDLLASHRQKSRWLCQFIHSSSFACCQEHRAHSLRQWWHVSNTNKMGGYETNNCVVIYIIIGRSLNEE